MRTISSRLRRLFLLIFAGITGYITWFTFTEWERAGFLYPLLTAPGRVLLIAFGALLLFVLTACFFRMIRSMDTRRERIFAATIFLLIFLGQLALIFGLGQTTFMYDPYRVFDEALHMLSTHTVSPTALEGYYSIYPNNIPFTLLCYWILRLGSAAGLTDAGLMVLLQVLNALCMDLAIFLTFRLLKGYVSTGSARCFLFFCLINPLVYLWPGFVYTSTVSMPFIMGGILLFLKLIHADTARSRVSCGLGLGIVLVLGFQIRATVLITLIAGLLYLLLYLLSGSQAVLPDSPAAPAACAAPFSFGAGLQRQLPGLLALLAALVLTSGGWSVLQSRYVAFDTADTAFPVVSWLAMGVEGDGMFNTQDYYDTRNAATAEEKKSINEEKLKARLKELGLSGWLELAGQKIVRTWADGTDDYVSYLNQFADTGKLHSYVLEGKSDLLIVFMQMLRCFSFLCVTLSALLALFRRKVSLSPLLLLQLNLLGGTFFHVLWETGELYSLCFSFLLLALAAAGAEQLTDRLREGTPLTSKAAAHGRLLRTGLCLFLVALTTGWMLIHTTAIIEQPVRRHTSVISQKTYTLSDESGLIEGNTLQQTFCADQPFNRVAVRVKNVLPEGRDSQYEITLISEDQEVLMYKTVTGQDVFDYDYLYLGLDVEASPSARTEYTLTITCQKGDADNSIAFLRYDTGNHDAYPDGTLSENGAAADRADLNFQVYRSCDDTYFSSRSWSLLCSGLLFLEGLLLGWWIWPGKRQRR